MRKAHIHLKTYGELQGAAHMWGVNHAWGDNSLQWETIAIQREQMHVIVQSHAIVAECMPQAHWMAYKAPLTAISVWQSMYALQASPYTLVFHQCRHV